MIQKRYGAVIALHPDKVDEYKKLHASVWPKVLEMISACHIQNYSIFLKELEGKPYLFSYFEYTGSDFAVDMEKMANDQITQEWWRCCKPCQIPLPDRDKNEWWAAAEEVFHHN